MKTKHWALFLPEPSPLLTQRVTFVDLFTQEINDLNARIASKRQLLNELEEKIRTDINERYTPDEIVKAHQLAAKQ